MVSADIFRFHPSHAQPFACRYSLIQRRIHVQCPLEGIVESVGSCHIFFLSDGFHIHTDSVLQFDVPVVGRHPRDDVPAVQFPSFSHVAVLDPYLRIVGSQRTFHLCVLHEDRRMRLHLAVHDGTLVGYTVLYGESRRNHLPARAVMVELASGQRQNRHLQLCQFFIVQTRMRSERRTEVGIHIIEPDASVLFRAFHHQFYRPVTQQPDTDVHQEEIVLHQLS